MNVRAWLGGLLLCASIARGAGGGLPAELAWLTPKLKPGQSVVFWQRTRDFRDEDAPAWLVGCGDAKSRVASEVELVDPEGFPIARAPASATGYNAGLVVRLAPGQWALALSAPAGSGLSSTVSLWRLAEPMTPLFRYRSPDRPAWNSALYFVDIDQDGRLDVLVDREIFNDGQRTREQALFRYDESKAAYAEAPAPRETLEAAARGAAGDPAAPRLYQYSLPPLLPP